MNRDKYVMMKEIVDAAIKYDGSVFGGYVRDFILHDYMACKFFEENPKATKEQYSDKTISPGTIDRLLVPEDIDVHFRAYKDFRKFKTMLKDQCIHSKTTRTANFYFPENNIRHIRLEMFARAKKKDFKNVSRVIANHINEVSLPFSVKVDVIITGELKVPLDFECNGLVMNSNGICLCDEIASKYNAEGKFRTFMRIVEDIKNKKARAVNLMDTRWDKMADKPGWTVMSQNIEKVPSADSECILCHESIPNDDVHKFSCCNAKYHLDCIVRTLEHTSSRCIHCRRRLYLTDEEKDVFGPSSLMGDSM